MMNYTNGSVTGNTSQDVVDMGFTETEVVILTYLWYIVIPVVFALIAVIGITGNSLVIYVILSKKDMRTVTNFLLLNLAVADIVFILLVIPYTAVKFAADSWPFGDAFCKLASYFQYVSVYVTVYTLVAVSAYRYVTIVWSNETLRYRTKRNTIFVIVTLWLVILCATIPTLLMHQVKTLKDYEYCGQTALDNSYYLYFTFFIFAYLLPLTLICILYLLILKYLRANRTEAAISNSQSKDRTHNACRIVVVVVVVFGLCWLPMHINFLLALYKKTPKGLLYEVLRVVWHCLAYANSCANPVIYNFASANFRKHFHEAICSCRENRGQLNGHVTQANDVTASAKLNHVVILERNGSTRVDLTELKT